MRRFRLLLLLPLLPGVAWAGDDDDGDGDGDESVVDEAPPAPAPAPAPERRVPGLDVGGGLAAVAHVGALMPGLGLRAQVGYRPKLPGAPVRVAAQLGWTLAGKHGEVRDAQVDQAVDWRLVEHHLVLAVPVSLSIADPAAPLAPEIVLAPALYLVHSTTVTHYGDVVGGVARELRAEPGGMALFGFVGGLGPGDATLHLGGSWAPLRGELTGPSHAAALELVVGYRLGLPR